MLCWNLGLSERMVNAIVCRTSRIAFVFTWNVPGHWLQTIGKIFTIAYCPSSITWDLLFWDTLGVIANRTTKIKFKNRYFVLFPGKSRTRRPLLFKARPVDLLQQSRRSVTLTRPRQYSAPRSTAHHGWGSKPSVCWAEKDNLSDKSILIRTDEAKTRKTDFGTIT